MSCIPTTALDYAPGGTNCPGTLSGISVYGVSCAQATYCVLHACDCESSSVDNKSPPHGCTVLENKDLLFNLTLDGSGLSGTMGVQRLHLTRTSGAN